MDERTFVRPIAQFLDPSRCLGACVVILFLRGSAGMVMYRELGCLKGLTDLHQGPREASQNRALRRCGFPLGQAREGASVVQGHWIPPAPPHFRPWSWTPSAVTTGASRAAALSPGRTCCLALTGSWTTFPAASSRPTEPLQMPLPHSPSPSPCPRPSPSTIHGGMRISQPD